MPRGERVEGYPRRNRFTMRGSFGPVLKDGRKLRGRLAVVHVMASPSGRSRLGIALTRKLVPLASRRNRVKRAIRELYRRHDVKNTGFDVVVTLRERVDDEAVFHVVAEVASLLDSSYRRKSRRSTGMGTAKKRSPVRRT